MRPDWFSTERDRKAARRRTALTTVVLAWLASCSLQDFDRLGPGKSGTGTNAAGEAGESSLGGNDAGLGGASAGTPSQGGSTAIAGQSADGGGAANRAGSSGVGGTTQGGSAAGASAAGGRGLNSTCPSFTSTGGSLLTPPSTGFETSGSWTTLSQHSCTATSIAGSGNACEGKSHLTCNGAGRSEAWDGPMVKLESYFVNGHRYLITAAVRYSPPTAPSYHSGIIATVIRQCAGSTTPDYFSLGTVTTSYEWARITGTVEASLPGCTALSNFTFYLGTTAGDAILTKLSLDMDDFRIYDLTPGAGGSGAGGGAGMAGSAGTSSANAGSAGAPRLPSGGASGAAGSSSAGRAGNVSSAGNAGRAGAAGNG